MPIGYLITVVIAAVLTAVAIAPPRRPPWLGTLSFYVGLLPSEQPYYLFYYLAASTALAVVDRDLATPLSWIPVAIAGASALGLIVVAARAAPTASVTDSELTRAIGADRQRSDSTLPWFRILLAPMVMARRDVRRFRDISYGDAGAANLLDVYAPRHRPTNGQVLVFFHGGGFTTGTKNREGRAFLMHMAAKGWLCISADYRMRPEFSFPDHHIDAKRAIAWAREHASEYGADAETVIVAGTSAGAHMATLCALTPGDTRFQPGFEDADARVDAAIGLYGYYGRHMDPSDADEAKLSSTVGDYLTEDAVPLLLAHGTNDSYVLVEHARELAAKAGTISRNPVAYIELPYAQHAFDLFHSVRYDTLIRGMEEFVEWVAQSRSA